MTDSVPVAWISYRQPTITPRGCWDTGGLELILNRQWWRPADALAYSHHIGFEHLPADADGAVVIIGAQHHGERRWVERLNADLARLRWVVLVLAGDECSVFPWADVEHPNMRLWIMTPRPHLHGDCPEGTTFIGEGYHPETPGILAEFGDEAANRRLDWSFAGQVTHKRRQALAEACERMIDAGSPGRFIGTPGFTHGLPRRDYLRLMSASKVVPCPSGPCTPDSFRFYEAMEAGCLPLADATTPDGWLGYWRFVYGDDLPFPVVEDWTDLPDVMAEALAGWPDNAVRAGAWWQSEKRRLVYQLDDDVRAVRGA